MNHSLRDAMLEYGLQPPAHIEPGKFHRCPGNGKKSGNKAGWCRMFPDGKGAVFGDFSIGLSTTWMSAQAKAMDKAEWLKQVKEAERKARQARYNDQRKASEKATYLWNQARPASADHPYLATKGIQPHGTRIDRYGNLLVPVLDGKGITSLQFIGPDGSKRFLSGGKIKGCYSRIGDEATDTIIICEGFATGATLHEVTGHLTLVAFNAGNLLEVAKLARKRYEGEIIICGDNDHGTAGNPGRKAAQEAAQAINGRWVIPDFTGLNAGPTDTDFNDLARLLKEQEVAA